MSAPFITINLQALQNNVRIIKKSLGDKQLLAMVKADAYGHGLIEVAKTIKHHVDAYAVARIDEVQTLRNIGINNQIVLMGGVSTQEELNRAIDLQADIVIHHAFHLQLLKQNPKSNQIKYWLKIQSTMHRLGFRVERVEQVITELKSVNIKPDVFLTHLPSIENDNLDQLEKQLNDFINIANKYKVTLSISNTAGLLKFSDYLNQHSSIFRIGRALYGLSPSVNLPITKLGLKPVMSFYAQVIAINDLEPGECVGYHGQYKAKQKERIAIINVGHGDGYPRNKNGFISCLGVLCPIRGWISMDMSAVAIPEDLNLSIGDNVQLWGNELPVEKLADAIDRSALENLMSLAPRVKRIYIPVHNKKEVVL